MGDHPMRALRQFRHCTKEAIAETHEDSPVRVHGAFCVAAGAGCEYQPDGRFGAEVGDALLAFSNRFVVGAVPLFELGERQYARILVQEPGSAIDEDDVVDQHLPRCRFRTQHLVQMFLIAGDDEPCATLS